MAKVRRVSVLIALGAAAGVYNLHWNGFVPPVGQPMIHNARAVAAAGAVAAMLSAAPASAKIESAAVTNAAQKFAAAAYPLMQEIDWSKSPVFQEWLREAAWTPVEIATYVDKILEMGLAMDPSLVKAVVLAHERGVTDIIKNDRFIPPQEDVEEIFVTIARAIGSAGSEKAMGVFNSYRDVGGFGLNTEMMAALGGPGNVGQAYKSFIDLVQVLQPVAQA